MPNLNAIQSVVFVLLMSLLGIAFTADKPATQADFNELQKQVQSIDKDLAVLKETKAGLEKRQNEITAVQANSLAAIANQTTMLGNLIATASILITLLVFGAGYFTFKGATRNAKEEAREASKNWFDQNATDVSAQIVGLKKRVEHVEAEATFASASIKENAARVAAETEGYAKSLKQAGDVLFKTSGHAQGYTSTDDADQAAINFVRGISEALKAKPESEFTAENFYARGLADYTNQNYEAALLAFENAIRKCGENVLIQQRAEYLFAKASVLGLLRKPLQAIGVYEELDQRFGDDSTPAVRRLVASGLVNKGFTLEKLDEHEQAITVYDDIEQRFGEDVTPGIPEQVARALNGKGFTQMMTAKKRWGDERLRKDFLVSAAHILKRALLQHEGKTRHFILGNLGYVQFLSEKHQDAEKTIKECLRLGGQTSLDAQLADAKLHRVEPQDTDYEKMLSDVWKAVQTESRDNKISCSAYKNCASSS